MAHHGNPVMNGHLRNAQPKFGFGGMGLPIPNSKGSFLEKYYPSGVEEAPPTQKYGKRGKKNSVALSALTLLAFLFFLNILQGCLQDNQNVKHNQYPNYGNYPNIPSIPSLSGAISLQPFPQLPVISLSGQVGRLSDDTIMESRDVPSDDNSLELDVKLDDKMLSYNHELAKRKLDLEVNDIKSEELTEI